MGDTELPPRRNRATISSQEPISREPRRFQELERAIDRVANSYDEPLKINNLESSALPNRRAVVEAVGHLVPVIYMGFYTTRTLTRDNLRHSIGEHLYAAHELLVEQIERALCYEHSVGRGEGIPAAGSGEDVVIDLINALPQLRMTLDSDVRAAFEGDPAASSLEEVVFSYPSVFAVTCHRIAHQLWQAGVPMIPRIMTEFAHGKTGIDIAPGAVIGESFFIDHGTGVVIGETCRIGARVKIYQGVTLGALSVPRRGCKMKRHPTLEDEVTVYAGATILGGDTVIGRGSVIGGNVWLIDSVPPGSKVFFHEDGATGG